MSPPERRQMTRVRAERVDPQGSRPPGSLPRTLGYSNGRGSGGVERGDGVWGGIGVAGGSAPEAGGVGSGGTGLDVWASSMATPRHTTATREAATIASAHRNAA